MHNNRSSLPVPHHMYFQALTNPFFRKPFLFTSIQNPRGVTPPRPLGALSRSFCSILCFQQLAASFFLFAFFLHTCAFVFSGLQPLLQKHRGYGGSAGARAQRWTRCERAGAHAEARA
jgi:hypothetical protein